MAFTRVDTIVDAADVGVRATTSNTEGQRCGCERKATHLPL